MQMVERDGVNRSWWMDRKAAVTMAPPRDDPRAELGSRLAHVRRCLSCHLYYPRRSRSGGPRSLILIGTRRERDIYYSIGLAARNINFNVKLD